MSAAKEKSSPRKGGATVSSEGAAGMEVRKSDRKTKGTKKEIFTWATPSDEFAEDVASDNDDPGGPPASKENGRATSPIEERLKGEKFVGVYNHEEQKKIREEEQIANDRANESRGKKSKKQQKFPCPKCEKIWNWPWELRRHLLMHFKEKERQETTTYKCDDCGKGFQWKRDLAQHRRLHTGEKLLVCSVCSKKFTTRQALLHHVVVHTGEKPFQCSLCGNRFTQPANLRTHMKKKHDNAPSRGNKCPHCQDTFPSVVAVHQHIFECHKNIVEEACEQQESERRKRVEDRRRREKQREESRTKRELRRKERLDHNDYKVKGLKEWEIKYEFHIGNGITRGVDWDRTPSNGELPCDLCNSKFGWRYEIMFHNLCHMVDEEGLPKNKICPECKMAFKVPIGLKHHLLIHTGEYPFLCLHCWRTFSTHIDLKLHLHREHLPHLNIHPKPTLSKKKDRKLKMDESGEVDVSEISVVMEDDPDQTYSGETRTIVVGSDGTIMNTEESMFVVLGDNFDTSQGVIVVDSTQLQHVVNASSLGSQDLTTVIIGGDSHTEPDQIATSGTRYINLRFTDNEDMSESIVTEGEYEDSENIGQIVVVSKNS